MQRKTIVEMKDKKFGENMFAKPISASLSGSKTQLKDTDEGKLYLKSNIEDLSLSNTHDFQYSGLLTMQERKVEGGV